jgi:succinate dehydrogenase flavin-adding protein (antitoxin of CptAB toxin-antitoxin module)
MRELDELLTAYLDRRYDLAPDDEKAAFRRLLALSDPDLAGYLLQREHPVPEIACAVDAILERART